VRLEIHNLRSAADLIPDTEHKDLTYELMRVISEILRNVSEHAHASRLSIQISDNGIGGAVSKEGSFGLIGIQERIARLNGETRIDTNERGTRIVIEIPIGS
jgi:signal transduction histidine kinase